MDFNWTYMDAMRRFARDSRCNRGSGYSMERIYCPTMLTFDVGLGLEIPSFAAGVLTQEMLVSTEPAEVVVPLSLDTNTKSCAGTDTMLKHFSRGYRDGRITQAHSSKGEIYYGNAGIILDKDFNPLLLATRTYKADERNGRLSFGDYIIHVHPNVFIRDAGFLEKALAKKGMAFYLSQNISDYEGKKAKVIIDDCSQFFKKANRPDINAVSSKDYAKVLKDNIDEVLSQLVDDELR